MRLLLAVLAVLSAGLSSAASGDQPILGGEESVVWTVSRARHEAANRGDLDAWERMTHPGYVYTDAAARLNDRQQSRARLARAPWLERRDWRDVRVQLHGDFAIVTCRLTLTESVPQGRVVLEQRRTEVYARQGGAWLAMAAQDSDLPVNHRRPAAIDAVQLADYAGVYDFAPGQPDTYVVKNGRLMNVWQGSEQELLPLGGDAFFTRDSLGEIRFVRDPRGRVTGYVWRLADGQEIPAQRLP